MSRKITGLSRMPEPCVLVAAGGTGGHLFPAESLADALMRRGVPVELATDDRAVKYGAQFRARAVHAIPAATPTGGGALGKAKAAAVLARGTAVALRVVWKARPMAVVGFGGYPTVPPLLAASILGAPTILHEQNAVMGRANRFLAGRVDAIATGFETLGGVSDAIRAKARHTGNPVRPAVIAAAQAPFPAFDGARLNVLVTGGSQGAKVMSDIVPAAMELLGADMRARIGLVQQARGEDETRVREIYARLGLQAEIAPFFSDLPARMGHPAIPRQRSDRGAADPQNLTKRAEAARSAGIGRGGSTSSASAASACRGIAEVLHNLGYKVQGSDAAENANVKRLRDKGIDGAYRP
jgi:UDP-N-acetylglucosamine--N-acetylmuramyl-(pentapeptide) pyrophosphoryl-undecaprenol N-acetylglucosamine transferase